MGQSDGTEHPPSASEASEPSLALGTSSVAPSIPPASVVTSVLEAPSLPVGVSDIETASFELTASAAPASAMHRPAIATLPPGMFTLSVLDARSILGRLTALGAMCTGTGIDGTSMCIGNP